MTSIRSDITVVGAGVVGLAASLRLAGAGLRVICLSRDDLSAPLPGPPALDAPWDKRIFAISAASQSLLAEIGAWDQMNLQRVGPVSSMCVFPSAGHDREPINFSADDANLPVLASIVEQSNLLAGLHLAMAGAPARLRQIRGELNAIDSPSNSEFLTLQISDGTNIRTRLLVAADGAQSPTRALSGIGVRRVPYGQTAVVAELKTEHPHRGCAYQWFGEHGVLALLPLPDSNVALDRGSHRNSAPDLSPDSAPDLASTAVSMVWSTDPATARGLVNALPDQLGTDLWPICGAVVGRCEALGRLQTFELASQQADTLISERVVLIGDAAHVVHPLAGQGLNLGLGDVATLGNLIAKAKSDWKRANFDPGSPLLLRRYRRHRAEPLLAMQATIDGLQRLFAPFRGTDDVPPRRSPSPGTPATAMRDVGWQLFARNESLRRLLIKFAAGRA
ncbi:MAG: FAD-dependent monooxygenase [Burkholderiaceae bacterium]